MVCCYSLPLLLLQPEFQSLAVQIQQVSARLGHGSIRTTQEIHVAAALSSLPWIMCA
jgi:hypothetical protein